jgi:dTDP-glucose 4,6-dehydratase
LIPLFVTNALEGKNLPIYGDGKNVRDWIYVLDHCDAVDFVIHNGKDGEVYNIGGGNERTNLEITDIILKELDQPDTLKVFVKDRPGHDLRYAVDCTKLKQMGWQPQYEFEKGMKLTIDWYTSNQDWWKKIKSGEYLNYYRQQYQIS